MSGRLQLTDEMIAAIERTAKHFNTSSENVLLRMVFSYAAKFERKSRQIDTTNVVSLRRDE